MRVLGFGTYDSVRHPRVQILLSGLAQNGDDVLEVNRPMGFSTAERVAMMQQPRTSWRLGIRLVGCWSRLAWGGRRAARRFDPDAVLVGYLGHFDVILARLVFPRRRIILDHLVFAGDTAADRGADTASTKVRLLNALDRLALRCADVIVVDTAEHGDLVPPARRGDVVVVPVGAPDYWFIPPSKRTDKIMKVVFFGLYTPLQGAPTIARALAELADRDDIQITMIGSGQDLAEAREIAAANGRVRWTDWVEADDIPAVVSGHDVCLGVFGTGPKALRVVPNKVFQGAAAGCAIVTSDTGPQRRSLGPAAVFVPPGDASALAGALRGLAADPARVWALREAAYHRATERFTPAQLAARLTRAIENQH